MVVFSETNFASVFFSFCYFVTFFSLLAYSVLELSCLEGVGYLIAEETTMVRHILLQSVYHFLNISKIEEDELMLCQTTASFLKNRKKFTSTITNSIAI